MLDLDPADAIVAALWREATTSRASVTQLLRAYFREVELKPRQQKRIKQLLHRVLASRARIDAALEDAAPAGIVESLEGAVRVLTSRVLDGNLATTEAKRKLAWIDWERVANFESRLAQIDDPLRRVEILGSFPRWLARRIVERFGDEADAVATALAGDAPRTIRVNTLQCSVEQCIASLERDGITVRRTEMATASLEVLGPSQLFRTWAFQHGWFELQDEASQLVAELVAPPPGGLVVDACAGAGGKTLAIAAAMGGRGTLVALDVSASRLEELRRRAKRAGVRNLRVFRIQADAWTDEVEALLARADRVLVDAPCSGLGSLRRNPDMRDRLFADEREVERLQTIQIDLCTRVASRLAPKSRLIYATCTVLPDENQRVVERVLAADPMLDVVRVAEILGSERASKFSDASGTVLETFPHRHPCDGFFAAVLRKRSSEASADTDEAEGREVGPS
ncbi:MAG: RsmB/NOP family class I SAM-dependent RNA methyltransferase [Planctomycetes bacterium]|nr:RsmB/NOP family class I SAM-dependent RNA methyltransferase [Planctomycetota bacterium]